MWSRMGRKSAEDKKKDKYEKMRKEKEVKERLKPGETKWKHSPSGKKAETKKEMKERWADVASQDWTFLSKEARKKLAQRINHEMGGEKNKKTIELAAGEIQHVKESHAIDFSKEMLKKNPSKKRIKMDLDKLAKGEKLPYKKKSVDGAMMIYGINYMKDKKSVINEISRVMKDKGKVFFFGQKGAGLREVPKYDYEPEKLKKMLKKEGFNIHEEEFGVGTLIEAGRKLNPERAENRRKIFERQGRKRKKQRRERREKQKEIKEKEPEEYQSTTDYWQSRAVFDDIEKKLQEKGIEAEIKPFDSAVNVVKTERENKAAPAPWRITFSVVTEEELPEKEKEEIKEVAGEEMRKEFKDYKKTEHLEPWRKEEMGPFFQKVLSKEEYKEKRKEARERKEK